MGELEHGPGIDPTPEEAAPEEETPEAPQALPGTPASDRNIGANAEVLVGLGTADPTVNVNAPGLGLASYVRAYPYRSRQVPGGGKYIATQNTSYREGSWAWTQDDNAITRKLFWMKSQRRFTIWDYPEGNISGMPAFKAQCIATIGWTAPAQGARQFTVALAVDGEITEGTV